MQTASRKVINGWAMYDWASSAYNLVITSTIFPTYFTAVATGPDGSSTVNFLGRQFENTALYNYAIAVALLIVAVSSPLLSSIADFRGNKKRFLFFFMTMGSLACASMYFFEGSTLTLGIVAVIVACVGFWGAQVFYNSFLPEIAAPQDRDRISAKGFSYGYVGSVLLQLVCFVFVLKPDLFGITEGKGSQISFFLVGVWWWAFGQFSLRRLPTPAPAATGTELNKGNLSGGYRELSKVWLQVKKLSALKRFLSAFFFYNMAVQTVMLVAVLYGKEELMLKTETLIIAILIIQLIAIPGAYLISRLSRKMGNLPTLMLLVVMWIGMCIAAYNLPVGGVLEFCLLGAGVGFVMGGIQSLSRSTYSKLMPPTKDTASFFSFYDVTEKLAAVVGIFSYGFITELSGGQRGSVLAVGLFFVIGLALLWYARAAKKEL
jgi:UMF1 family MFS transporter